MDIVDAKQAPITTMEIDEPVSVDDRKCYVFIVIGLNAHTVMKTRHSLRKTCRIWDLKLKISKSLRGH
jgi:hypothetical protein